MVVCNFTGNFTRNKKNQIPQLLNQMCRAISLSICIQTVEKKEEPTDLPSISKKKFIDFYISVTN